LPTSEVKLTTQRNPLPLTNLVTRTVPTFERLSRAAFISAAEASMLTSDVYCPSKDTVNVPLLGVTAKAVSVATVIA
jgi:hypothetical protein